MTEEQYERFLLALAAKHVRPAVSRVQPSFAAAHQERLDRITQAAQLARLAQVRDDDRLSGSLREDVLQSAPVHSAASALEDAGILDAIDDAGPMLFAELRRSAIPREDFELLTGVGYSADEIEILVGTGIHNAPYLLQLGVNLRRQLDSAEAALRSATERLNGIPMVPAPNPPKKKKLFNGIGKILGGSITGIGNALIATGTIAAPNPATAAGAIASGGLAISMILQGAGDLRGE